MGETFNLLRRLLKARRRRRVVARLAAVMQANGLSPADIVSIAALCRARNDVAHPQSSDVDLTDADPESIRIFEAVRRVIAAFPRWS